jgi:CDP-glycerol glycerophosphotransferase (TagB/SpsB family)/glycosyltransferase involved in cell wall biosynthesis
MAARRRSRLRKLANRVKLAVKYEMVARSRRGSIDANTVFYESFSGNGMLCNPEAIFRALLAAPDMGHLKHVWALTDLDEYAATVAEFAGNPRVKFVKMESPAYYSALSTAKYLVNNATFPPQFGKRDGQIYVNTWHGTPLKAMGYDIPGGALNTRNVVRNLVSADYLLAPNEQTADMYLRAYRMANIYNGRILAEGTPRIDHQFADESSLGKTRERLRASGVVINDEQQILLYAPTWKGDFYAPTNDVRQMRARVQAIRDRIDTSKYQLLLKLHQQVHKYAVIDEDLREILVPNEIPTNEMLAASEVVITDYSSIFIDFLTTNRPVLFFAPDLADYEDTRGWYLPVSEWPGPVTEDIDDLARHISQLNTGSADDPAVAYKDAYAAARERYTAREDGQAAQRVIDVVFRGRTDGYDIREGFNDGRTSILIHLGGMLNNGITSSALCLLDNIDHSRYDITATFVYSTIGDREWQMSHINPNVRIMPRIGGINGSKWAVYSLLALKRRSVRQQRHSLARHRRLLHDEWVRCFGEARFDHVVDFSGYSPFWVKVLAARTSGSLSIWLHNDMQSELNNSGRTGNLRASVRGCMALYREADHLVSVSSALADVNRKQLTEYAPAERFSFARNTINHERVRHLALGITTEGTDEEDIEAPTSGSAEPFDPADLRGSIERLMADHGVTNVRDEVERRATIQELVPPMRGMRTFVTAGRLSSEKNHERLIRAFDIIHQEDPATRLIILGAGPLRMRLNEVVDQLGLTAAVTLAGFQPNPYAVVANSDCFVLSSDYEGQPMVLLEALVLGTPVVTTSFGSVRGALPKGYGLITARSVDGLADGMRKFLQGEVPTKAFDYVAYNHDATQEFYRAIGAA